MRNRYPTFAVLLQNGEETIIKLYGGCVYKKPDEYGQRNIVEWANKGIEMVAEQDEVKEKEKAKRKAVRARAKRKVVTP